MVINSERGSHRRAREFACELGMRRRNAAFSGPVGPDECEHANDHFALVYESRDEQLAAVIPFIRRGLERGERCLYVADENSREEVLDALEDAGVDVDAALDAGALSVLTVEETYLRDGTFDVEESIALLENAVAEGTADFEGLRVSVEETWLLREDAAIEDFMALEARVNDIFRGEDCIAVCQYNSERFPPAVIRDVIRTHPHLVQNHSVTHDNLYYTPPGEFLGPDDAASQVDRMLETLRKRNDTTEAIVQLFESGHDSLFVLDPETEEIIEVSDSACEMLGYSRNELQAICPAELLPDDMSEFRTFVDRVVEDGTAVSDELSCRTKEGRIVPAEFSASTIGPDKRPLVLMTVRDYSNRRDRERFLRALYEIAADSDRSFDDKLEALFDLGREQFDLEVGGLARIDPEADLFEVEAVSGDHDHLVPDARLALSESYCRVVANEADVVGITDPLDKGLEDTMVYDEFGLRTYLGTHIEQEVGFDRTLFFVSSEPRDNGFSEIERGFHDLMGQWIGYELERNKRQRELEKSERRYRTLAEHFPGGAVGIYDHDLRYTLVEGAMWDDMEPGPEVLEGLTVSEFFPEATAEDIVPNFRAAVEDGETSVTETEWRDRTFQVWTTPLRDSTDEIFAGMSLARDITDRTERERELELFRKLIDQSNDSVFVIDPDTGQFLDVNDTACERRGYDRAELLDLSVFDVGSQVTLDDWRNHVEGVRAEDGKAYESIHERKDGTTFPVEVSSSFVELDQEYMIGIARDITERKANRAELQQTKERFQKIFEHSNDAIFITDPYEDKIIDSNSAGLELLGYDRDELLSLDLSHCHPDEKEQMRSFVDDVYEQGYGWTDDLTYLPKNGDPIPVEVSASTIELEGSELLLTIVREITERKKHERFQRRLYELTTAQVTFDEKLDRLLDLGRERFGLDTGLLTHDEGNDIRVVKSRGASDIEDGFTTISPHIDQFCRKSRAVDCPFGVPDMETVSWDDDPLHQEIGLGCYLGVRVTVDNKTYGTLCFADGATREEPFTDAEQTFLELMAHWIGYELERDRHETQLAGLNAMSRDLMDAETPDDIATVTVNHAEETLQLPVTALITYNQQDGTLSPAAQTPRAEDKLPTVTLCDREAGPLWEAFVADEVSTMDDIATIAGAADTLTEVVAVPLDQQGLFVTATTADTGFTTAERDFIETTAATVQAACTRTDREKQLHDREATLAEQNRTLERLNRINTTIRNIDQALVQASTRPEIEEVVCRRLADVGPFELAWIGDYNEVTDEVTLRESAGGGNSFIDGTTVTADGQAIGQGLVGRAIDTGEPQVVNDILEDQSFGTHRQAALNRGYHACIALPLDYENSLYGVLVIYTDQPNMFDELEQAVMIELANTIAYAINAVESKKALISNEVTRLEFNVDDTALEIVKLARDLDCEFVLESLVPRADGGLRMFFSTRGAPVEDVLEFGSGLAATDLTLISTWEEDGDTFGLFDASLTDSSLGATIVAHGGRLYEVSVVDDTATVIVELATDAAVREFVEMFQTKYPDSELVAQRSHEHPQQTPTEFFAGITEALTARQLESLQTAYFSGYFDEPRPQSASDIAETMDIAQSTFNTHIRAAHSKVCQQLFEEASLLA